MRREGWVGKYPDSCQVFSTIEDIRGAVAEIKNIIDRRYEEYEAGMVGERKHPPILVVAEEFPEIAEEDYETLATLKSVSVLL